MDGYEKQLEEMKLSHEKKLLEVAKLNADVEKAYVFALALPNLTRRSHSRAIETIRTEMSTIAERSSAEQNERVRQRQTREKLTRADRDNANLACVQSGCI